MANKLFLLLLPTLVLLSDVAPSLSEKCHPEDKRALLEIKKELNNPTLLSSWKPHRDCCQSGVWYGVECSPYTNRVSDLTISNNTDIAAQFPASIGSLTYLESLYITLLPNLTGPIPKSITNLRYLTISSTSVSGPIPKLDAEFKSLVFMDLSDNALSGTLPPSLSTLPVLQEIQFNNNKLTGPIPPSYGYFNNSNLPSMILSYNLLSGSLPESLARLNGSIIDFSHNRFEGDASVLFGSAKQTLSIDLSWNLFAFDLGKVQLSNKLNTLDVSHNHIFGTLPVGIENIRLLNVSYNSLCGEIPKGGNMKNFDKYSFFHNKCLCGSPLPRCKQ
ncbi:Polygalacturonase inhibitor 1, partial [Mucuna pruriens]